MSNHIFWIASYPKSRNTLLKVIVSAIFFSKDGTSSFELIKAIQGLENKWRLNFIKEDNPKDFLLLNKNEVLSKYWLLKSEPSAWSWSNQVKEKTTMWDGVRNYQARNNLIKMKKGDLCFFYHSVSEKSIVGIVEIVKESYPDPTDSSGKFVVVDVKTKSKIKKAISLEIIKKTAGLENIPLLKQSRLSVMPISNKEWGIIIKLSLN